MAREEKKYEILPGVQIPDLSQILNAASDFSAPGVEGIEIDHKRKSSYETKSSASSSGADISELQALGDKVAEDEAKAQEESRRRMEAIKSQVIAPESLSDLSKHAATEMSEERRAEIEKRMEEQKKAQEIEEAKRKAREERRLQQQKALEESLARKAAAQEAKEAEERKLKEEKEEEERKARKEAEIEKQKAIKEARAAKDKEQKAQRDDDYKAWVKAKREAAIKEQEEKKAAEEAKRKNEEIPAVPVAEDDAGTEADITAVTESVPDKTDAFAADDFFMPSKTDKKPDEDDEGADVTSETSSSEPSEESRGDGISSDKETLDDFSEFL